VKGFLRRKLVWGTGIAVAIVVAALALTSRQRLVEEWHLFRLTSRLTSPDASVRLGAIDRLSRMDSPRTITALYTVVNDPAEEQGIRMAALNAMNRVASNLLRETPWESLWGKESRWVSARLDQPDT
jgi:hypothetical protein